MWQELWVAEVTFDKPRQDFLYLPCYPIVIEAWLRATLFFAACYVVLFSTLGRRELLVVSVTSAMLYMRPAKSVRGVQC